MSKFGDISGQLPINHNEKHSKSLKTVVLVDPISSASKYLTLFKDKYDLVVVVTLDRSYVESNFAESLDIANSEASKVLFCNDVDQTIAQLDGPVDAVVPCSEPGVIFANLLSSKLKLISNNSADVMALRDKAAMRQIFHKNKVNCPRFIKAYTVEDALNFSKLASFPLVCKNPLGAGGNLVFMCESEKELEQAANTILQSRGLFDESHQYFVVEKHIAGNEFAVNLFNDGKNWNLIDICQYHFFDDRKLKHGLLTNIIQLDKKVMNPILLNNLYQLAVKGSEALNIKYGPAHCEIIQNSRDGELFLIEIGARIAGANLPWVLYKNNNINLYQKSLDIFLQGSCEFTPEEIACVDKYKRALMFFYAYEAGDVNNINGCESWKRLPSYFMHTVASNFTLEEPTEWGDACCLLYLSSKSTLQLQEDVKKARRLFRLNNQSKAA